MLGNEDIVLFIKGLYGSENIVLHEPVFHGNEKKYLCDCIDSTFVSYVGQYVTMFENMLAEFTGVKYAAATVSGTAALHAALNAVGVSSGDEVITQSVTFVATANSISYCNAHPVFVDVDLDTLGMSPEFLEKWLSSNAAYDKSERKTINKSTGKRISAIIPVHIFGHPCRIEEICRIAEKYDIPVVEDSTESLGSFTNGIHTGLFGKVGVFSFNGNKTITTGGGGMVITNDKQLASYIKHITTTAKIPHKWECAHDEIGYNYRMPNINAAVGCAQIENIRPILMNKRETAAEYINFFKNTNVKFIHEPENSISNYWLNSVLFNNKEERDSFLEFSNKNGVMTRPLWKLMHKTPMFSKAQTDSLKNSLLLENTLVNLPSGFRAK